MTFKSYKIKSVLFNFAVLTLAVILIAVVGNMLSATVFAASGNLLGDTDGDGEVTINDVTCIQRSIAMLPVSGGFSDSAADVDGSGKIDITDATVIQRWLAGMETIYPIGEQPTEATTQSSTDADGWGYIIFEP